MALSRHHRIPEDKQVLLTHDGRLLEHQQMIGAYGVGTVGVAYSFYILLLASLLCVLDTSEVFVLFVEV